MLFMVLFQPFYVAHALPQPSSRKFPQFSSWFQTTHLSHTICDISSTKGDPCEPT